jgi:NADPH:quinone reductase-like Zn-dependent oxidoreductase
VTTGADQRAWQALGQAAELHEAGKLSVPVEQTFPLNQAPAAQRRSEAGHVRGKLVLIVD